jgi:hypothetical protein
MQFLAWLFVGKPLNICAVAALFLAAHLAMRITSIGMGRNARPLLVTAGAWAVYAAWEWLVVVRTPEANIRVDLLAIWPVLALLSAWSLFRALR